MTPLPTASEVERRLQSVAQLRALFRELPHLATPGEERQLAAFDAFRAGVAVECRAGALAAGFRRAWRAREFETIAEVAARIPLALLRADRDVETLAALAREVLRRRGRGGTGERHSASD